MGRTSRRSLVLAGAAALAVPAPAAAHLRTGTIAVDAAARVTSTASPVHASVNPGNRLLHVSVPPGHTLVLLGYLGEPFARIGPHGVSVARGSATAESASIVRGRRSLTWRDDRLVRLPPSARPTRWSIPVVVDGRRSSIDGIAWWPRRPAWWPWLLTAALAGALAALGRGSKELVSAAFGTVSAVCALGAQAALAFDAYASAGVWIALLDETAFALAGAWLLVRGPRSLRAAAGAGLGAVGLAVALSQTPVVVHPIVLSVLPGVLARALVSVAAGAGAAALVAGALVYAAPTRGSSTRAGWTH